MGNESSSNEKPNKLHTERISARDFERELLQEYVKIENALIDITPVLAQFYASAGKFGDAIKVFQKLRAYTDDPEQKADCYLKMGQVMEQAGDYVAAIEHYKNAFALESSDKKIWYFTNNNIGYCLNQLSQFLEAESYCREAIKIDPERHNAHKNLGLSLTGQGKYAEAAICFVRTVQITPQDPRAFIHLEDLINKHNEVAEEIT